MRWGSPLLPPKTALVPDKTFKLGTWDQLPYPVGEGMPTSFGSSEREALGSPLFTDRQERFAN